MQHARARPRTVSGVGKQTISTEQANCTTDGGVCRATASEALVARQFPRRCFLPNRPGPLQRAWERLGMGEVAIFLIGTKSSQEQQRLTAKSRSPVGQLMHAFRGGSWVDDPDYLRSGRRVWHRPGAATTTLVSAWRGHSDVARVLRFAPNQSAGARSHSSASHAVPVRASCSSRRSAGQAKQEADFPERSELCPCRLRRGGPTCRWPTQELSCQMQSGVANAVIVACDQNCRLTSPSRSMTTNTISDDYR